jgi:hypothetical protein
MNTDILYRKIKILIYIAKNIKSKMLRRSLFSQEVEYSHQSSPRKWRSIQRPTTFLRSILRPQLIYKPPTTARESQWIGKYVIPYQSTIKRIPNRSYVSEYEIMRTCGMYVYRLIFVEPVKIDGIMRYRIRSKPTVDYRPGQMNIYVTPDLQIVNIEYF